MRVVTIDQNDASTVTETARPTASSRGSPSALARRQFAVRKTMWDSVSTKTIVMRFARQQADIDSESTREQEGCGASGDTCGEGAYHDHGAPVDKGRQKTVQQQRRQAEDDEIAEEASADLFHDDRDSGHNQREPRRIEGSDHTLQSRDK